MSFKQISLEKFSETFASTIELSSVAIGGKIVSVSDEFFAEAFHLLLVEPAPSLKGQFGPKGALYSGWESRRHNPDHDWCILKLGTPGSILGVDIDTSNFSGNEAPQASVQALFSSEDPLVNDSRWTEVLPKVDLGPNSRHLFETGVSPSVNYVKLNMLPDGGIARFRVYGNVTPEYPLNETEAFDLAHVFAGGRVEVVSDQHFGVGSNLILPGRGVNMGDGWETKRSRQPGHNDWVIIKLGFPGYLEQAEIDTAHFMGNFPESVEIHALHNTTLTAKDLPVEGWTQILTRIKTGPHRRHFFQLENVEGKIYTHVKVIIHPDGGMKRVRIIGKRASGTPTPSTSHLSQETTTLPTSVTATSSSSSGPRTTIPILPLTPEAFAPFGKVIQAYADHNAAPRGIHITAANQGTASKFHTLAFTEASYPATSGATLGLSVYRCDPLPVGSTAGGWEVKVLERHPYTTQAFVPMGAAGIIGRTEEGLKHPGDAYLVVVAQNNSDGQPEQKTIRAFAASAAQGIMYNSAVWHQPMAVFDNPMDFTCIETQIGNGDKSDCEILELDPSFGTFIVKLATL